VTATGTARKADDKNTTTDRKVTRADIEAKLNQIQGGAAAEAEARQTSLVAVGVVAVVVALLLAYFLGRRRGKKRRTVVEIKRI
jgi:hypothetical protein